jgi:hypothetical protein
MTKSNHFAPLEPLWLPDTLPATQNQVLAEVVYGLVSRDCKGMGICKIKILNWPDHQAERSQCGSSLAWIRSTGEKTLCFDFLRQTINPQQYARRFASGSFLIEEPFSYPKALLAALGSSASEIPDGNYALIHSVFFISVEFTPC